MSINWSFCSFSAERWTATFGGASPDAVRAVAKSALWEEFFPDDPPLPEDDEWVAEWVALSRDIVAKGIDYGGRSQEERAALDDLICSFFCPEGLEEILSIRYESPEFVHLSLIEKLLRKASGEPASQPQRPGFFGRLLSVRSPPEPKSTVPVPHPQLPTPYLELLTSGRRFGLEEAPHADARYLIMTPTELRSAKHELEQVLALPGGWSDDWIAPATRTCMIDVYDRVAAEGRWLAGVYG